MPDGLNGPACSSLALSMGRAEGTPLVTIAEDVGVLRKLSRTRWPIGDRPLPPPASGSDASPASVFAIIGEGGHRRRIGQAFSINRSDENTPTQDAGGLRSWIAQEPAIAIEAASDLGWTHGGPIHDAKQRIERDQVTARESLQLYLRTGRTGAWIAEGLVKHGLYKSTLLDFEVTPELDAVESLAVSQGHKDRAREAIAGFYNAIRIADAAFHGQIRMRVVINRAAVVSHHLTTRRFL